MTRVKGGRLAASFRDPAGFVFRHKGAVHRQVNRAALPHYQALMQSGLYEELTGKGLLISHREASLELAPAPRAAAVLRPRQVPFDSYPYEWCFGQLKAAALTTLAVQRAAISRGMCLKDASAFNIQFFEGAPVFIDTLSFMPYEEGSPWVAYQQFCSHFLAPLALMARKDHRLGRLMRLFPEGIPLDLASGLLPAASAFSPAVGVHLKLHAKSQARFGDRKVEVKPRAFSRRAMEGLIDSLERAVKKQDWSPTGTQWADYYDQTNYSEDGAGEKLALVERLVGEIGPESVWDLGANNGLFSRAAAKSAPFVASFDMDMAAVEQNWRQCRAQEETGILPLVMDLNNPSPGLGWEGRERDSLAARGPATAVLALALVHHLAIGNNLPYERIAQYFARLGKWLIVEFVPPEDSQAQRLLSGRDPDGLHDLSTAAFEEGFSAHFALRQSFAISGSQRVLYLCEALERA